MPDIDRTVDIKVNADRGMMTAEILLAGHASEHWRELFGKLAAHGMQGSRAEAEEREEPGSSSGCLPPAWTSIQSRRWMLQVL